MSLMGLDIGTTGCKALVISEDMKFLTESYIEYSIYHRKPGWSEFNVEETWKKICLVIGKAAWEAKVKGDPIKAIAPSVLGEAVIPIDQNGIALDNSPLSFDRRGIEEKKKIDDRFEDEELFNITGHSSHLMYTLSKLLYWINIKPNIFLKTWKFLCWQDYIFYKLCGYCVIDYSLAARTLLFDINKKKWSRRILSAFNIDQNLLSEPLPSGTVIGYVDKKINKQLKINLPSNCALVVGGWDQACAALGAGVVKEGIVLDNTGTTECIIVAARKIFNKNFLRKAHFQIIPHILNNYYLISGGSLIGGSIIEWYRDNFGDYEIIEAARKGINPYDIILKGLSQSPSPIIVLPWFAGSGTPSFDQKAKGLFWGLTLETTRKDIVKGLLDGLGFELRNNLDFLKKNNIIISNLFITGGASRSNFWVQQKCNVTGYQAIVPAIYDTSALGAALIAGYGIGIFESYEEIIKALIKDSSKKQPVMQIYKQYTEKYKIYKKIYSIFDKGNFSIG